MLFVQRAGIRILLTPSASARRVDECDPNLLPGVGAFAMKRVAARRIAWPTIAFSRVRVDIANLELVSRERSD